MLAIPPFWASSNIALWRANSKPPVELVVNDLGKANESLRRKATGTVKCQPATNK